MFVNWSCLKQPINAVVSHSVCLCNFRLLGYTHLPEFISKMLDFFSIFSKGGIVLWYFQGTSQLFTQPINALIKTVILQVKVKHFSFNKY